MSRTRKVSLQLKRKVGLAARAAASKKAENPVALDLRGIASFTDCFFICTGMQTRQTQAICDAVVDALRAQGVRHAHIEGYVLGEWILIDYSDLVVHVFTPETRDFYGLEKLWGDASALTLGGARSSKKRGLSATCKG